MIKYNSKNTPTTTMKKVNFVYFDLGGVVVDYILALEIVAGQLTVDKNALVQFFTKYANDIDRGSLSWEKLEDRFYKKLGPSQKLNERLHESFVNNFQKIEETQRNFVYR